MLGLDSLNLIVSRDENRFIPKNYDFILHYFLEKGITLDKFIELPIPYILNIINTQLYIKEEEQRAIDKK